MRERRILDTTIDCLLEPGGERHELIEALRRAIAAQREVFDRIRGQSRLAADEVRVGRESASSFEDRRRLWDALGDTDALSVASESLRGLTPPDLDQVADVIDAATARMLKVVGAMLEPSSGRYAEP